MSRAGGWRRWGLPLVLVVQGCAGFGPVNESAVVHEAVTLAVTTATVPEAERQRALERARGDYERAPGRLTCARLALLLATLPEPQRDDERAKVLLEWLAAGEQESDLSRFARLLATSIAERQQLARELQAARERGEAGLSAGEQKAQTLQRQVEGLQRELRAGEHREEALRKQVESYRGQVRAGEYREATLRKQIEALREAERSMLEHERRLPVEKR